MLTTAAVPWGFPIHSLSHPDIQNRHVHICRHISSAYASFPFLLTDETFQPSARSIPASVFSQLSHWLQSCTSSRTCPWHSQGIAATFLPTQLPKGPLWPPELSTRQPFLRQFHLGLTVFQPVSRQG